MINLIKYHIKVLFVQMKIQFAHKKLILFFSMVSIILIGTCFSVARTKRAEDSVPVTLGIINEDKSKYSKAIIESFKNNDTFNQMIAVREGTKEDIYGQFERGKLDVYLIIPKDFVENMMYINNPPVEVKINGENTAKTIILKNVLQSYEKYIKAVEINAVGLSDIMRDSGANKKQIAKKNMDISISLVLTVLGKEQFFKMERINSAASTSLGHYYFISILFIFLFYGSLHAGLDMIEELRNGTLNRMKAAGVFMVFIICSKIIVLASFLFLILTIPYLIIGSIMKIQISFLLLLFLYLFLILLGGLAVLISAFVKSKERFMIVFHIFGFFTIIFGGGVIPTMYLPKELIYLSKGMPNYWFMKGFLWLEHGYETGSIYFLILPLIISIEILAGAYLYQRNEVYHE